MYVCLGIIISIYNIWRNRSKWYYWIYKINGTINEVSLIEVLDVFMKIVLVIGMLSNGVLLWVQWYSMFSSGMERSRNVQEWYRLIKVLFIIVLLYKVMEWLLYSIKQMVWNIKQTGIVSIGALNGLKSNVDWIESMWWRLIIVIVILWWLKKWRWSEQSLIKKRWIISIVGLVVGTVCSSSEVMSQVIIWVIWQVNVEHMIWVRIDEKWNNRYKAWIRK